VLVQSERDLYETSFLDQASAPSANLPSLGVDFELLGHWFRKWLFHFQICESLTNKIMNSIVQFMTEQSLVT
jgi:hypothetical protein